MKKWLPRVIMKVIFNNEELNKENSRQIEMIYLSTFETESLSLIQEWERKFQ